MDEQEKSVMWSGKKCNLIRNGLTSGKCMYLNQIILEQN